MPGRYLTAGGPHDGGGVVRVPAAPRGGVAGHPLGPGVPVPPGWAAAGCGDPTGAGGMVELGMGAPGPVWGCFLAGVSACSYFTMHEALRKSYLYLHLWSRAA